MDKQDQNFVDSRTLIAIVLMAAAFFGWQFYMQKKYPNAYKPQNQIEAAKTASKDKQAQVETQPKSVPQNGDIKADEIAENAPAKEQTLPYSNGDFKFTISSRGMGLKDVVLNKYKDENGKPMSLGAQSGGVLPLATVLAGSEVVPDFTIEQPSPNQFVGRAKVGGLNIVKTMEIIPGKYSIETKVAVGGDLSRFTGVETYLAEPMNPDAGGGIFSASRFNRQELFVHTADSDKRVYAAKDKDEDQSFDKVGVVALSSNYFSQAILDRSSVLPEVKANESWTKKSIVAKLLYKVINPAEASYSISYVSFLGPKSVDLLKSIDSEFVGIVDFGIFAVIGRPILKLLNWFHDVVGNWGFAIILLTLLVRFAVLPFNVMSFKSMKGMQAVQPQIKAIKEKYKDDPAKVNQETMELFKSHKVNPLGGCLPMLLQMPIFFALYGVLEHSVELYQAPFIFWIHDLSHRDPLFILPILMGITMYFQQRLTPTTVDPAQAKIMALMPVFFTVLMVNFPSGLNLYIFVSSLFGVVQQMYLLNGFSLKSLTTN